MEQKICALIFFHANFSPPFILRCIRFFVNDDKLYSHFYCNVFKRFLNAFKNMSIISSNPNLKLCILRHSECKNTLRFFMLYGLTETAKERINSAFLLNFREEPLYQSVSASITDKVNLFLSPKKSNSTIAFLCLF